MKNKNFILNTVLLMIMAYVICLGAFDQLGLDSSLYALGLSGLVLYKTRFQAMIPMVYAATCALAIMMIKYNLPYSETQKYFWLVYAISAVIVGSFAIRSKYEKSEELSRWKTFLFTFCIGSALGAAFYFSIIGQEFTGMTIFQYSFISSVSIFVIDLLLQKYRNYSLFKESRSEVHVLN